MTFSQPGSALVGRVTAGENAGSAFEFRVDLDRTKLTDEDGNEFGASGSATDKNGRPLGSVRVYARTEPGYLRVRAYDETREEFWISSMFSVAY